MKKRNNIIYWVSTLWLALGMASTGVVQLMRIPEEVESITHLGYPVYMLTVLGIWKLLGVGAILVPRTPLLKEWTYAGFFFVMTGAVVSHLAVGDLLSTIWPPALLIALTAVSWYFRPADRKTFVPK